jgi:hypothetical protein
MHRCVSAISAHATHDELRESQCEVVDVSLRDAGVYVVALRTLVTNKDAVVASNDKRATWLGKVYRREVSQM